MMNAIILHGTANSPEGNWFRWLEAALRARGWNVWLPQLPHASKPSLRTWTDFILSKAPFKLDSRTVVIGHSSGAVAAVVLAQLAPAPLRAVFAVSFFKDNDSLQWDALDSFFDVPFDFDAIQRGAGHLVIIHSDTDPYCPLSHPEFLRDHTGGELIVIPGQGHFNLEAGPQYKEFPRLLEIIDQKVGP